MSKVKIESNLDTNAKSIGLDDIAGMSLFDVQSMFRDEYKIYVFVKPVYSDMDDDEYAPDFMKNEGWSFCVKSEEEKDESEEEIFDIFQPSAHGIFTRYDDALRLGLEIAMERIKVNVN